MICRRCGMDSSTTDTCEWCKKPMLPPGGAISAKAKQEILKEREQGTPPPTEEPTTSAVTRKDETELEAVIRRPEAAPPPPPTINIPGLTALGMHAGATEAEEVQAPSLSSIEQTTNDALLLPLGAVGTTAQADEGADQTIYVGNDEEVLRPIERPSKDGSRWVVDAAGRRKRVVNEEPEVPEKVRLMRGAIQGGIIAFILALVEFFIYKKVPDHAVVLKIADPASFAGALMFAGLSAVLMGFMLSALLVSFKKGPVFGFLLGFPLGWALVSMAQDNPGGLIFPFVTGCLCGIVVGRAAVKGLKRVVTV